MLVDLSSKEAMITVIGHTIQHYTKKQTGPINYVNPYGNGYRGYRVKMNSNR